MAYEHYIKFGTLDSEWVDWYRMSGPPLPLPPPPGPVPLFLASDATVQLSYVRLYIPLWAFMVAGTLLDEVVLVVRKLVINVPQVVLVARFQRVFIDACLLLQDNTKPFIYFGYDNVMYEYTNVATARPPLLNPQHLLRRLAY
jgi:hypothetical protein